MKKISLYSFGLLSGLGLWSCAADEATVIPVDETAGVQEAMISVFDESADVTSECASLVASNLMEGEVPGSRSAVAAGTVSEIKGDDGSVAMYVVNYGADRGWVIVSADKGYGPVLAWNDSGVFDVEGISDSGGLSLWVDETKEAISRCGELPDSVKMQISAEWRRLTTREVPFEMASSRGMMDDDPLLTMAGAIQIWQSRGYEVYPVASTDLSGFPFQIRDAVESLSTLGKWGNNVSDRSLAVILATTTSDGTRYGPYITTKWTQGYPYNYLVSINGYYDQAFKLGCAPVAMGQIMKYHGKPATYDFASMPDAVPGPSANLIVSSFLMDIAEACGIDYSTGSLGVAITKALSVFNSMGYSGTHALYDSNKVISSLRTYGPVYIHADYEPEDKGHAWILDGYSITSTGTTYRLMCYSGDFADISPELAYWEMTSASTGASGTPSFHMVWGYNSGDGWYSVHGSWTLDGYSYTQNRQMIYDIH